MRNKIQFKSILSRKMIYFHVELTNHRVSTKTVTTQAIEIHSSKTRSNLIILIFLLLSNRKRVLVHQLAHSLLEEVNQLS